MALTEASIKAQRAIVCSTFGLINAGAAGTSVPLCSKVLAMGTNSNKSLTNRLRFSNTTVV